jgi:hypothetical protein
MIQIFTDFFFLEKKKLLGIPKFLGLGIDVETLHATSLRMQQSENCQSKII